MPSFSTISVFATLALAAFTSAVPTAAPGVDLEVRAVDLEVRQTTNTVLTGLASELNAALGTITTTSDAPTISNGFTTAFTALQSATGQISANPTILSGLSTTDCINGLTGIFNVLGPILVIVFNLIQAAVFSSSDCDILNGLLVSILTLLAQLIGLVLSVVPCFSILASLIALLGPGGIVSGLLATIVTLVITLITPTCGTILSGCLSTFNSCGLGSLLGPCGVTGLYPAALGGLLTLVSFLTPILDVVLLILV